MVVLECPNKELPLYIEQFCVYNSLEKKQKHIPVHLDIAMASRMICKQNSGAYPGFFQRGFPSGDMNVRLE